MKKTPREDDALSAPSDRYQDYVIKDGRYVGRFEEMYRHSAEIPWHQDHTVNAVFSDLTVAILKNRRVTSMLDVGCGLGYMTARMMREIPTLERIVGLDISETAIVEAMRKFPGIEFRAGDLDSLVGPERFDVVVSKDVIWYVLDALPDYLAKLAHRSSRWIYIGQSFPERRPFYGDQLFPDAAALLAYLGRQGYRIDYSAVERDAGYGGREYVHIVMAGA
jgi:SAM-dependent methyltransferase